MSLRVLALCVVVLAPQVAAAQDQQFKNGQELVGTWTMLATINPGAPICPAGCVAPALSTINSDGTLGGC